MAAPNICTSFENAQEEDDSEYSYEYVTDSEYESDDDSYEEEVVVSETVKLSPQTSVENPQHEVDNNDDSSGKLSKAQIEAMKPKLPHYVTDPEPCAFSDDPAQWIAWMEEQVNNERERRMKKLMDSNSFEATEVNDCTSESKTHDGDVVEADYKEQVQECIHKEEQVCDEKLDVNLTEEYKEKTMK